MSEINDIDNKSVDINLDININLSNISNFSISFLVDLGSKEWYNGQNKQEIKQFLNEDLKKQLPKNKIFKINSLFFNFQKHRREILSSYDCFYNEENNSMNLILSEDFDYALFTKEIMINLLEFTQKVNIETFYILISKKNKQYSKIIDDMNIVGFRSEIDENFNTSMIEGQCYKVLFMPIKETTAEIEEVVF